MIQKQTLKQEITKADMNMVSDIYELVRITIKDIYKRYYSDEAVKFFLEFHSKENMIMDFLETEIVKHYGAVWLGSSLPAGKFYHDRGYMAKKYEEIQLENDKVLAYELMCRNQFPIDPNEYNAPSQLVRREMELQGIDLDELRKIFPKRVYLLADSLYDTMLSQNAGTLTYHVGGEVYILSHNHSVGFVKGEMCSPGIATQAEDLMAAGARELIHVGFAGGYPGTHTAGGSTGLPMRDMFNQAGVQNITKIRAFFALKWRAQVCLQRQNSALAALPEFM